jgi:hypothetical protein
MYCITIGWSPHTSLAVCEFTLIIVWGLRALCTRSHFNHGHVHTCTAIFTSEQWVGHCCLSGSLSTIENDKVLITILTKQ